MNDDNDFEKAAEIFVAIVYHKSKEAQYSRAIKQTVASVSDAFTSATKLTVTPLYTAIGEPDGGYSVRDIETVCATWNHKPVVAAVVFGSFKSSFGHVLTSLHNNIPVLWATGEVQPGYFERVSHKASGRYSCMVICASTNDRYNPRIINRARANEFEIIESASVECNRTVFFELSCERFKVIPDDRTSHVCHSDVLRDVITTERI